MKKSCFFFRSFLAGLTAFTFLLFLTSISAYLYAQTPTEPDVLFQIGYADGYAAEFRHGFKWEDLFDKDQPIVHYVVGKNRPRDWYRWHNSTRDWHAAGRSFYSLIEFEAQKDYEIPLYFVVATCYGHPTEPSQVELTVNGTVLEPKRVVPGPPGFPKWNSDLERGWPENMRITIPAGLVKKGKNLIKMRLFDGSWAIWDYLALREKDEPLPDDQVGDLLKKFRAPGGPMEEVHEILFAEREASYDGHWYANFGYYACDTQSHPFPLGGGGALRILNLDSGEVRTLFEDPHGNIRDPQVHYDAQKCVFSYLKAGTKHYNLYEINLDGTGLRQITSGDWDDIEPCYLPNGDIVFPSSRAKRWVQCWLTGVANLHRCGPNGENIHTISANPEQENTPWVLPNGQILYMRWEYVDRSQVHYHHLWTTNPDGTKHQAFYGNQAPGICMLGAKPIYRRSGAVPQEATANQVPQEATANQVPQVATANQMPQVATANQVPQVVTANQVPQVVTANDSHRYEVCATFSPGHGMREHYGTITLVDPKNGPDDPNATRPISIRNEHADPWAFGENAFLCVKRTSIVVLDGEGREQIIYTLPTAEEQPFRWCADVQPIIKRPREEIIAASTDPTRKTGLIAMANLYEGRKMKDVPKGTVKELLVCEATPIPVHYNGGMMSVSSGGTFAIPRVLGRVPVSPDGSAYMELPAKRALYFIALDEKGNAVKRMHSFTSLMPGEVNICIGCHEDRTMTPTAEDRLQLMNAMKTPPAQPEKIEGIPEVFDYFRDIVPILNRNCLECHNEARREGGVSLDSDLRTGVFVNSYGYMSYKQMFGDNRNRPMSNFGPYEIGSQSSTLFQLMESGHADKEGNRRVNLTPDELRTVQYWLNVGANYAGTYAADACGSLVWGYSPFSLERKETHDLIPDPDRDWPELKAMVEMFNRRCVVCHKWDDQQRARALPGSISRGSKKYGSQWAFNLSFPEKSNFIRCPLATEAGGFQRCKRQDETGKWVPEIVFKDVNDPDYQIILACIKRAQKYITEERSHFSIKPFHPNPWYAREMVRYGVLPPDYKEGDPIDPYETDRKYWDLEH